MQQSISRDITTTRGQYDLQQPSAKNNGMCYYHNLKLQALDKMKVSQVTSNNKYIWIDYIRVVATFSVVLLHSAAPLLYQHNEIPAAHWMTGNIYDSIVRMSVPLFLMISGCLLLEKIEPLKMFFIKRVNKVLIPLVAWSIIYIFWKKYYEGMGEISYYSFYSLALSPTYYHLWFLYVIIGIYLFLPILRVMVGNSYSGLIHYYLVVWFIAVAIIPFLEQATGIKSRIDFLAISGYSGYLVLGFFLGKIEIIKTRALYAALLFFTSIAITALGTYFLTLRNKGIFNDYFYGYLTPNVILTSAATFILIKYSVGKVKFLSNEKLLLIINSLSSASLGIYLIHVIFIYLLKKGDLGFTISGFSGNPAISIPATALITFLLSYVFIIILRKIPFLKIISP